MKQIFSINWKDHNNPEENTMIILAEGLSLAKSELMHAAEDLCIQSGFLYQPSMEGSRINVMDDGEDVGYFYIQDERIVREKS